MSQECYIGELLERFGMTDCRPVKTPADKSTDLTKATDEESQDSKAFPYRQMVGSLIYLMATRPGISWTISKLSQFLD